MDSPFFLLSAMGPIMGVFAMLPLMLVPAVLYLVIRWRAQRDGSGDNQVGVKFALHYFIVMAVQIALMGGTLLIYTVISTGGSEMKSVMYRVAFGLLVPAAIVLVTHMAIMKRTNDDQYPSVRRVMTGYNLLITGLLGLIALVLGCQALFMKGDTDGLGHLSGAMVLVYCTAWALLGYRFGQLVLPGGGYGHGEPPQHVVPPQYSQQPPPQAAQQGLPSLGGGSYPPIEPK